MFEINITIHCPDLVTAASLLVKHVAPAATPNTASASSLTATAPTSPAPAPATTKPVTAVPTAAPAPTAPVVPLAQTPQFTLEQISRAGAELITKNPGILPQVNALLGQFGAQTLDKLRPDQMGPFATALRGLGAKI